MKRAGGNSSKTIGAETNNATTISVAKNANVSSADDNRACFDGGSRENECGNGTTTTEDRVGAMQPICHGSRQEEKLLCLWRFQAHGPPL